MFFYFHFLSYESLSSSCGFLDVGVVIVIAAHAVLVVWFILDVGCVFFSYFHFPLIFGGRIEF